MCLSTAYIKIDNQEVEVMKDVARIESQNNGFLVIGLLGEEKSVRGEIRTIDFIDNRSVVFESNIPDKNAV
jgi:predicted RNA-binding protein